MNDDTNQPPIDSSNEGGFRDRIEEFLKLCDSLRKEAMANGLDKNQFNALLASILQEEEQEAELRAALHTSRVEEFLETCKSLRVQAKAHGMTKETLDIELIASLMDNQARFSEMKQKKEEKDRQKNMMQNLIGKIGNKPDSGHSR